MAGGKLINADGMNKGLNRNFTIIYNANRITVGCFCQQSGLPI